jgi:hypothetical protein
VIAPPALRAIRLERLVLLRAVAPALAPIVREAIEELEVDEILRVVQIEWVRVE